MGAGLWCVSVIKLSTFGIAMVTKLNKINEFELRTGQDLGGEWESCLGATGCRPSAPGPSDTDPVRAKQPDVGTHQRPLVTVPHLSFCMWGFTTKLWKPVRIHILAAASCDKVAFTESPQLVRLSCLHSRSLHRGSSGNWIYKTLISLWICHKESKWFPLVISETNFTHKFPFHS